MANVNKKEMHPYMSLFTFIPGGQGAVCFLKDFTKGSQL